MYSDFLRSEFLSAKLRSKLDNIIEQGWRTNGTFENFDGTHKNKFFFYKLSFLIEMN